MIPYSIKRLFYIVARYPMKVNGLIYKHLFCPMSCIKAHLGPGQENYLAGWVNVDANILSARIDVWANLIDPIPFRDNSVDVFYSHHMIEHLPDAHLPNHFAQMFQALRPGGGIRIGAPHVGNACLKYVENDREWFSIFPDCHESIGGRFTNFVFCRGEHLSAMSESYLAELAESAGFIDIKFCLPTKETSLESLGLDQQVLGKEFESDFSCPHTIIREARKPN